jgi:hypothetical protein
MRVRYLVLGAVVACGAGSFAHAQISVNATITGQVVPGVYGQVMIGSSPPPPVVYAQPVVIEPPPVAVDAPVEPIYLHVPPGHARDWRRHCHEYHACNRPVYFVRSAEYEPGYRPRRDYEEHGRGHGHEHEHEDHGHHGDDDHHGHGHHDD